MTPLGSKAYELFNFFALNMVAACTTETVYKTKSLQSPESSHLSSRRCDSLKSDDVTTKWKTFSFEIGYIKKLNKCTSDLRIQFYNTAVTNMFRLSCGYLQGGEKKNRNTVNVSKIVHSFKNNRFLALEEVTDRLSRNVGNKLPLVAA